ncbi:uncharacterized protein LOC118194138 [Stegodyphus dumicola]|uniref:uncharacterized protein LOC118194138 n=1 Tax=Stegodyphus dumicola TaxID=202533 RepID=UPI0015B30CE0|nr:uncharacterized protein LOC118194138 [Stegodyphus dumicola]
MSFYYYLDLFLFCKVWWIVTFFPHGLHAYSKEGDYAVLRGAIIRMDCVPMGFQIYGGRDIGASYNWTYEDGNELVNARFTKFRNGQLEITNAHIGDSGVYKCKYIPSSRMISASQGSHVFEHKLMVYEISGRKFVSRVYLDMSETSIEVALTMLRDLMVATVCRHDLCFPDEIKTPKCEFLESKKQVCEFSIPYEAVNQIADERCQEDCVRENMLSALKKAEKNLETSLMSMSENENSHLKADMVTFETQHLITCKAGFHLIKSHFKRCFPCHPGTYSKANSLTCDMCSVGFYQERYGKHECEKCEEGKTTETMGAKSKEECVPEENKGILNGIKEGILSIFTG